MGKNQASQRSGSLLTLWGWHSYWGSNKNEIYSLMWVKSATVESSSTQHKFQLFKNNLCFDLIKIINDEHSITIKYNANIRYWPNICYFMTKEPNTSVSKWMHHSVLVHSKILRACGKHSENTVGPFDNSD
jgi:hypothetical protein